MKNEKIIDFINRDLETKNRRIRIGERYKTSQRWANFGASLLLVTLFGLLFMAILGGK